MKTFLSILLINGLLIASQMNQKVDTKHTNQPNIELKEEKKNSQIDVIPADAPDEYLEIYEVAKDYIEFAPLSRTKLYEILISEGHSAEDVIFVVNTIRVDWKQNALTKAKRFLQVQGVSKREMIDQLSFEGYSEEDVRYAVKKLY